MDFDAIITNLPKISAALSAIYTLVKIVVEVNARYKGLKPAPKTGGPESAGPIEKISVTEKRKSNNVWRFIIIPVGTAIFLGLLIILLFQIFNTEINFQVFWSILLIDIALALFLFDRWVYFFAQFVLPIHHPEDRREIYLRVYRPGPVVFVRNGSVIMSEDTIGDRGPGIVILDTASAAVLRTSTEIKKTLGPGVTFTQPDEYISGTTDLRIQRVFAGPVSAPEPFLTPATGRRHAPEENRRTGKTRDGVEISPTLSVTFRVRRPLEVKAEDGKIVSQFGFDAESAHKAITNKVRVVLGKNIEWHSVPIQHVVELWKEYIRKFRFDELFGELDGLKVIEEMIARRLTAPMVLAMDDSGLFLADTMIESPEYKNLNSYGLEVLSVRIHKVQFSPEHEEGLISRWSPASLSIAARQAEQIREIESRREKPAREEAARLFARTASAQVGKASNPPQGDIFRLAHRLILPVRDYISRNNLTLPAGLEERNLDRFMKWLLANSIETPSDNSGRES